jgi:integrase
MGKPTEHYGQWRIRWFDEHGKRQSAVYPSHREALHQQRLRETEVEERKRGLRAPDHSEKTFLHAALYWEQHKVPLKRSGDDDISMLKQLRSFFAAVRLNDYGGWIEAVDRYRAVKGRLSDKTIANHLGLLLAILRLAHDLGWLSRVPKIAKPKVRLINQDYSYLRNDEEIRRFLEAAQQEGEMVHAFYATAVYTGLRAGELAALQWSDVDLEQRLITVHRSFDGPTKSSDVRHVPVLDVLLPVLRAWRLRHPGRLVFTNRDGEMIQPAGRIYKHVFRRVLKRARFEQVERNGRKASYIRFHDTRHTFASSWVLKGGDLFKLQKILGHKTVQMTMRYAHLQPSAFVEDHARFGTPHQPARVIGHPRLSGATAIP